MELLNWYILTLSGDADNTCSAVGVTGNISFLGNNRSWSVASTLIVLLIEHCRDEGGLAWHGLSWGLVCTWKNICWEDIYWWYPVKSSTYTL